MTTPGPDEIYSCPHCGKILSRTTIASGNTFGSTLWSDAKLEAPMLQDAVQVTRCTQCRTPFFVEDAKRLGEVWHYRFGDQPDDESTVPREWLDAPAVEHADANTLSEMIGQIGDVDRQRYLRTKLWHAHNDPARRDTGPDEARSGEFGHNLERLAALLDEADEQDRLLKAEILRELGRCVEAAALLQDVRGELKWAADQIRDWASAGVSEVRELERG